MKHFILVLMVSVGFLAIAGCGGDDLPPNYKTSVKIIYNNAPVEGALVTLRPDGHEAPSANGVTDADGTVQLFSYKGKGSGVIPGKYLVAVEKQNITPVEEGASTDDAGYGESSSSDDRSTWAERDDALPPKYIQASKSGLDCTVTEDAAKNVFEFTLED